MMITFISVLFFEFRLLSIDVFFSIFLSLCILVEQTKIFHESGTLMIEKRATWYQHSKETHTREEAVLGMAEALKLREEVRETFQEWLNMYDEAEVITSANKIQEEELKSSFRNDAGHWCETERKSER